MKNHFYLLLYFFFLILFTPHNLSAETEPPFLILLVDARDLNYSSNIALIKSLVKHPSDGSKNSDVGHAWIYLEGNLNGKRVFVEGGHSGERGISQAKYFEGIVNAMEFGDANPNAEKMKSPSYEPNPVKYLWEPLQDGFFQEGSGKHRPTFAAKVPLTDAAFFQILDFIQPENYAYEIYSLKERQCCSFVSQVAALAGLKLESEMTIEIDGELRVGKERLRLWEDPVYKTFTFSSPDILQKSLKKAVQEGCAIDVTKEYLKSHPKPFKQRLQEICETVTRFPERLQRAHQLGVL